MRLHVVLFTFFISTICSFSQTPSLKFTHITTEDGLSSSWVRCIYQDKTGFIWFGTSDGVDRYDGYTLKVFKPKEDDPYSLIHSDVNYITEHSDGKLWICTTQGVNILNLENFQFLPFPYLDRIRVIHVMTDNQGRNWFSTYTGVFVYSPKDSSIVNYLHDPDNPNSLSYNQTDMVFQDKDKNIWIATQLGVDRFIPESGTFEHFTNKQGGTILSGNLVRDIVQDKQGRIWFGLNDAGLDVGRIDQTGNLTVQHVLDCFVNCMLIDKKNTLWVGNSMGFGIRLFDLNSVKIDSSAFAIIEGKTAETNSLSDNSISSLYEDRTGAIWIGTYARGVNYYNPAMKKFNIPHNFPGEIKSLDDKYINCFLRDDPYFWIGTEEGLYRIDLRNRYVRLYEYSAHHNDSLGASGVLCLYKDSHKNLWIGTWDGDLNRYNYEKDDFIRYKSQEGKPGAISSKNIFAILEDKRGNLWIGTNGGGLNRYDYSTRQFQVFLPDSLNSASIYHNAVNDICETSDSELFISVYHALEWFDYKTETFRHFVYNEKDTTSISSGSILDIFEDSRKNLWVSTTSGLNLFNKKEGTFRRFGTNDGLPNNTVQAIAEDNNGNLWLSTNNGLSKFNNAIYLPEKPVFDNYFVIDGLKGNEFVRRSVYKHSDGWLYFGGTQGYTFFHPDSIHKNVVPPKIVLTHFRLLQKNERSQLENFKKDINLIKRIDLKYNQNNFIIQYAALNYLHPLENQYKYILEGFETKWQKVGTQREATYTNIDPGKYVFKVMGTNNDGVWCTEAKTLEIVVHPPWWGTLLFKILVILFIILSIYIFYKLRVHLLEQQKKLLEEMVNERTRELSEINSLMEEKQEEIFLQNEELNSHRENLEKLVEERTAEMHKALLRAEEADKLKSAFLANMSHEIRTPMNAIVGFANLLKNVDNSEEEKVEFLSIILNNCDILMVLINDILEISLIEANQLKLKKSAFSVNSILSELESYFQLNNVKKLKIYFKNKADSELILSNDATRFRQIFVNLINNAYKYTDSGEIEFGYKKENDEIIFYVKDTGIGIAESEYEYIFGSFHKIDKEDNQLYRGAGIGLSISNRLVELMGGKIWLQSTIGKGTTFFFTFSSHPEKISSSVIENVVKDDNSKKLKKLSLENKTIIVAEDVRANYILIEKILKKTKANILWAKNGSEAVELVENADKKDILLVLMDIKMPIMNGIRASELIGQYNSKIPIIAVTAYAQEQNKEEILRNNFVDYISKPINAQKLLDMVYKYTGIK